MKFLIAGVVALMAGCGGQPSSVPVSSGSAALHEDRDGEKRDGCLDRADFDEVSQKIDSQLNITRRVVCKYRRIEEALADGYVNTGLACVPGQGYHYIKNSLVGTTDIRHPPVLMYTKDGDLNSPEWVAPVADFPAPPSIFGQTMHAEDELGLWILHVWVWKLNSNGVFDDVNPAVACP
jgi:hypothetical protein